MTVQKLCDELTILSHQHGKAQCEVKVKILDVWYDIEDFISHTECGDKEWFNIETRRIGDDN